MAHRRADGKPFESRRRGIVELAEEVVHVERLRRHPAADLSLPQLARPVGVDLDPVPVRVSEVDRLADVVVGEAGQRHPVARGVREPAGEVDAARHEQREVIEAGVSDGRPRARLLDEHDELGGVGAEGGVAAALLQHVQPDDGSVVVERAGEIGDGEVHRAHRRRSRERDIGHRSSK